MANLIQFDIQSEWTRLFTDSSFSKYQLTEKVKYKYGTNGTNIESDFSNFDPAATDSSGKPPLLDSVTGDYVETSAEELPLTKIASKKIDFDNYVDQYGNTQVKIAEYTPSRCPDRDYRVVGIILNNTNHVECNEPWDKLPSAVKPATETYDCENGWLECIADPDRWFKKFLDKYNTGNTFIRYESYNNNMTPMYYVLGVGPMMNNSTTLDKTNFRDYWCNNKICLFIYTIKSNVDPLLNLVKNTSYEFIKFYNESDVDFITNGTVPQLTNYINDHYEIKSVNVTTDSYTYIQNKGNTFIKPSNIVSNSVFGPFTIKRIGPSSKDLTSYTPETNDDGEYTDNIISILTSSNNTPLSGARFSKKFGSRNNTEVLSGIASSEPQFEITDYSVYITSYYDFSANNPYIRFGEGITEVYCEIEEKYYDTEIDETTGKPIKKEVKLSEISSLNKYEYPVNPNDPNSKIKTVNDIIDEFIENNKPNWAIAAGEDKANEIASFYNSFKWTKNSTNVMEPPYEIETISNPKKHVPCRIVPVWNSATSTYDWGLYCGSINVITNDGYKNKLYTNNGVKLKIIESETGYVIETDK